MPTTLQELMEKYKVGDTTSRREVVHTAFQKREASKKELKRVSLEPETTGTSEALYGEMARIQLDLADLAEEYGKLNMTFRNLIGSNKLFTFEEATRIFLYNLLGRKEKARELKISAAVSKGIQMETLVDKMAEILNDQYQNVIAGKEKAKTVVTDVVSHMKALDRKLVESLRGGLYNTSDQTVAEEEIKKLEQELAEITDTLLDCETKVKAARAEGSLEKVNQLTDEMSKVLDIKQQVLDGKLFAENTAIEIRREMLNYAEGLQSAKGATAASRVNYEAANAMVDALNELEIKYRHARQDMIPVFKSQAKISAIGMEADKSREALIRQAELSQRLMDINARLVMRVTSETFELLKTPVYDPEKTQAIEEKLKAYMQELNRLKKEWAESQQEITASSAPHYARPE